jgi:HSP20 family protein
LKENTMANLVTSGYQSIPFLRRELEDLFDEMDLPRRMRREMDRLFAETISPMSLWREMDLLLEEFGTPVYLRRRVNHVFSRVLSVHGDQFNTFQNFQSFQNFPHQFTSGRFGDSFYNTPWRSESFNTPWRTIDQLTSHRFGYNDGGFYNTTPWRNEGFYNTTPWRNEGFYNTTPWRNNDVFFGGRGVDRFNRFDQFERPWSSYGRGYMVREDFVPPVELIERDGEYIVRVELAGVREQDVEIRTNDHVLTIRGERRERFDNEGRHVGAYEYSERRYGTFSRTVTLPQGIDTAHIHATFRDGVLELRIPMAETFRQRRIPIGRDEARVINEGNAGVHPRPHVS